MEPRRTNLFNQSALSKLKSKNILRRLAGFLVLIVIVVGVSALVKNIAERNNQPQPIVAGEKVKVPDAKKTKQLNRDFQFPLKNEKGEEVSKIKYIVENAELRDQIIVQGQKASSVEGRTFLIFNIKLVNEFDKPIEINTKDYVRLSVNNVEGEWLAPDIHNDPVTVQAISTKFTRVGFPINDSDKNIKLQIGELKGEKQIIDINF